MSKPIRVFYSELSGRFYASSQYKTLPNGNTVITGNKFDVTNQIGAAITQYGLVFTEEPGK